MNAEFERLTAWLEGAVTCAGDEGHRQAREIIGNYYFGGTGS